MFGYREAFRVTNSVSLSIFCHLHSINLDSQNFKKFWKCHFDV